MMCVSQVFKISVYVSKNIGSSFLQNKVEKELELLLFSLSFPVTGTVGEIYESRLEEFV